jgi:signal transduction histidine kinase/predicted enzyme related to lactoylglutathione lyase
MEKAQAANADSALHYLEEASRLARHDADDSLRFEVEMQRARFYFLNDDIEKSEHTYRHIIDSFDYPSFVARAYLALGHHYSNRSLFTQSRKAFDMALGLAEDSSMLLTKAHILSAIGVLYDRQGLYARSLAKYMEALKIYEGLEHNEQYSAVFNSIAIVYKRQGDFDNAAQFYQKAFDLSKVLNDSADMAVCMVNLGLLYKDTGEYEKSEQMLQSSLDYFERTDYKSGVATVLHNMGELRRKQENFGVALRLYEQSNTLAATLDYKVLLAKNNLSMAHVAHTQGDYNKALLYARKSLQIAETHDIIEDMKEAHELLSLSYEHKGEYAQSLKHFKAYSALKDTLFNASSHESINKLKAEYELTQKEQEITGLKNEAALQDARMQAEQRENDLYLFWLVILMVFFVFGAFSYFKTRSLNRRLRAKRMRIAEQKEEIEAQRDSLAEKNDQLTELNKKKDEIIAIVAHDLRSPLNRIIGLLDLLSTGHNEQYRKLAMESAEGLRARINHMLDIEALNANHTILNLKQVEVKAVVNEVYRNFESVAARKNIALTKKLTSRNSVICADPELLREICENLVSNAIKFSPAHSEVSMQLSTAGDKVRVHVKDQGPGINEADKPHLFKKFRKLSARPTGNEQSSGLGLAIVKKFVDAQGGKVWCESARGKGAEFIVEFPGVPVRAVETEDSALSA